MNPLVSVCMITYNHEKFISEAIEGVLMQKVAFEVELIISDDCSSDHTDNIIYKYIQTHPRGNWIKYKRQKSNLGMMPNFIWALEACQGKYIALCEGDDYWIDSSKLQRQVDFLEKNSYFSLSFHNAYLVYDNNFKKKFSDKYQFLNRNDNQFSILDLQKYKWFIPTCSMVFRRTPLPSWFSKSTIGDFSLHLILSKEGYFYYHSDVWSSYRIHQQGVSNFINTYSNRLNDISLWFWNVKNMDKAILVRWYFSVLWRGLFKRFLK